MINTDTNIQIPVVVVPVKDKCDVLIPDLNVTIHGRDIVEALALSISYVSAIYYYNVERNYRLNLSTTYEQALALCPNRKSFATYIGLTK